ncbi:N-acetyltransferase [Bacillus sp. ISL-51]|uniref:N-acetyltransferase n=1 Tax=unclassified Bacillus (in: firmicutes) TaxID=185979 RepID=UPI001BE81119|nr:MULTISPECIES: N-acetyltransferase [unclassified Bacillus (in: firmicutes)]MBT2573468.1 N-acetyltransferase [Bacillus sp. ISL-51]MBT2633732.1 N-acetyltransferase [Bacillus sp. ISL-26]
MLKIERLLINFKTLEEFKRFKEYGMQELSMLEELQDNIIENDSTSPFYGIYFGDKLVARMSLYQVNGSTNPYFDQRQDFLELWKLEVLPGYQKNGYGKALVDFAKSFRMPIRTNSRMKSADFWDKMNFEPVKYDMARDKGENPYIWHPDMDGEMTSGESA